MLPASYLPITYPHVPFSAPFPAPFAPGHSIAQGSPPYPPVPFPWPPHPSSYSFHAPPYATTPPPCAQVPLPYTQALWSYAPAPFAQVQPHHTYSPSPGYAHPRCHPYWARLHMEHSPQYRPQRQCYVIHVPAGLKVSKSRGSMLIGHRSLPELGKLRRGCERYSTAPLRKKPFGRRGSAIWRLRLRVERQCRL